MLVHEMTEESKPREKFATNPNKVSEAELIAILLRTGRKGHSVLEIAQEVMRLLDGLNGFEDLYYGDLMEINGIGRDKAITVCAAIELGRRLANSKFRKNSEILNSPEKVANFFMEMLRHEKQENFVAAYLTVKNNLLGYKIIGVGNMNASPVDIREIMKWGIRFNAYGIILLHNHPSGDPTPSKDDIHVTKAVAEAAKIMHMQLLDHVVIGDKKYVSMVERGYI